MEWTNLIPWGLTFATVVIAIITLSRNGRKDRKAEYIEESTKIHDIEQSLTRICVKLDSISDLIKETKSSLKDLNTGMHALDTRVTTLERDLKTAFKVIDELKAKLSHEGV